MRTKIILSILIVSLISSSVYVSTTHAAGPYRDYNTFIAAFKNLANAYPTLASYESIGKTVEGRDILMFKIGNPNGGKVLFDGAIHGWESLGGELLYLYAKWLLTSNDSFANRILTRDYTLIIPAPNTDGYNRWRVNANNVDLNRNFATNWENAGSTDPTSEWYRGPAPLSEPESQTLVKVFQEYKPRFYVNLHAGDGVYYGGSYYGNRTYYSSVVTKINSLSKERGVTAFSYLGQFSGAGYAISDAARLGITSFLMELSGQTYPTLSEIEQNILPRFIPFAAILSQESETKDLLEDNFETGNFNTWTGTSNTLGESTTIGNKFPRQGSKSATFKSNGNSGFEGAFCYRAISPSSELYARGYFLVTSSGIVENNDRFFFILLKANGNGIAYAGWRKTQGTIKWNLIIRDGNGWISVFSNENPLTNNWYCIELHWVNSATNGIGELYVNNQLACSIRNANTTAFGPADQACFGLAELYNCGPTQVYCDACKISKTDITSPPEWDLNLDGSINALDLVIASNAHGSILGSPDWDPRADLNADETVNILDLVTVASHLEE